MYLVCMYICIYIYTLTENECTVFDSSSMFYYGTCPFKKIANYQALTFLKTRWRPPPKGSKREVLIPPNMGRHLQSLWSIFQNPQTNAAWCFNPSEKYKSVGIILPNTWKNKNVPTCTNQNATFVPSTQQTTHAAETMIATAGRLFALCQITWSAGLWGKPPNKRPTGVSETGVV